MTPLIRQEWDGDCGIAAIGMIAGLKYADVYRVVADPERLREDGLQNRDVVTIAAKVGLVLVPTHRGSYDLDAVVTRTQPDGAVVTTYQDEGVLRIRWNGPRGKKNPQGHFVAVKRSLIFCPTAQMAYDWRVYLKKFDGRECTLLRVTP